MTEWLNGIVTLGLEADWGELNTDDRFAFTEVVNAAVHCPVAHIH